MPHKGLTASGFFEKHNTCRKKSLKNINGSIYTVLKHMKVRGFTEIEDSLGSHLGVPHFCKALVVGLYPTHKSLRSGDSSTFDKHFGTIFKDGCSSDTPIIATFKRIQWPSWWLQKGWQFEDT
jgi:hypothetical protein